jgi:hypothetical protein
VATAFGDAATAGLALGFAIGLLAGADLVLVAWSAPRWERRPSLVATAAAGILAIPGFAAAGSWAKGPLVAVPSGVDAAAFGGPYWVAFALTFVAFAVPITYYLAVWSLRRSDGAVGGGHA